MIFITLGSQKFQFNRLLKVVDRLIENGTIVDDVFAQIGYSDYIPVNYEYNDFLDHDEFALKLESADIIISHGGTGTIISAIKKGKKIIAVPRLAEYGEHVDSHQVQLVRQFKKMNLICECLDVEKLDEALEDVKNMEYKTYQSKTSLIIQSIISFIEENV